jgi:hypothetical protein
MNAINWLPVAVAASVAAGAAVPGGVAPARAAEAPHFAVEPFWPKPLPDNWILGQRRASPPTPGTTSG